jgi:hypothetical protein
VHVVGAPTHPNTHARGVFCPAAQLEAVVRRILWLTGEEVAQKVLVFSSWEDVLSLVAHALTTNGVPFAHAKSGTRFHEALRRFRGEAAPGEAAALKQQGGASGPVRTLLLQVKQGANGLNLTGALARVQLRFPFALASILALVLSESVLDRACAALRGPPCRRLSKGARRCELRGGVGFG